MVNNPPANAGDTGSLSGSGRSPGGGHGYPLQTTQFKSINSLALSFLHSLTLTSIHDYRKNHSCDWADLCRQSNVLVHSRCQIHAIRTKATWGEGGFGVVGHGCGGAGQRPGHPVQVPESHLWGPDCAQYLSHETT